MLEAWQGPSACAMKDPLLGRILSSEVQNLFIQACFSKHIEKCICKSKENRKISFEFSFFTFNLQSRHQVM
jgi:hypothetical protein